MRLIHFSCMPMIIAAMTIAGCGERDAAQHDGHDHNGIEAGHIHETAAEDDHDHDAVDDHDHEADHDHDAEDDDHGHDHDAEDDHDHDVDHDTDHDADDDHDHDHDADDDDHDHEAVDDHDHDADDDHDHDAGGDASHSEQDHDIESGALIQVEADWEHLIGLETAEAHVRPLQVRLSAPGVIIPLPDAHATVSPFIEANVDTVLVTVGDRVERGQAAGADGAPAEYDRTGAELVIRERVYERRKTLIEDNVISRRTYEESELELQTARVGHTYALEMLRAVGLTESDLSTDSSCDCGASGSSVPLRSPIAGIIVERNAHIGQKVDSGSVLFEIIDPATVWVKGNIFEKDLTSVAVGQQVAVRVAAFAETFDGTIFHIGSTIDEATKTVTMLAEIPNPRELLKPGMYAATDIALGDRRDALVVPREAVLNDEHLRIVFVNEDGDYHRHVVETGMTSGGFTEITGGLYSGDIVVTTGNFQLKSRLTMGSVDPHAGHAH